MTDVESTKWLRQKFYIPRNVLARSLKYNSNRKRIRRLYKKKKKLYNDYNRVIKCRKEIFCKNYKHKVSFRRHHDFLLLYSILIYFVYHSCTTILPWSSSTISVCLFLSRPRGLLSIGFRFRIALRVSSSFFTPRRPLKYATGKQCVFKNSFFFLGW